jgi:hypothetical protein
LIDVTAMSVAAKALGFPGTAALIEGDQLSPLQVAALFAVAASERATKDGATVILAAATGRFNACTDREGFDGDLSGIDPSAPLLGGSRLGHYGCRVVQGLCAKTDSYSVHLDA